MSVRRIKDSWYVDICFEHASGREERVRKKSPVNTKRGAEEYERHLRAELLRPTPARKEIPTFKAFVEERWWPVYPDAAGNRPTTQREKQGHLERYLKPSLGQLRLDEITHERIERLYAELIKPREKGGKGLGLKTRRNVGATLRKILVSAFEWEVIEKIPRFPRVRIPDAEWDFFNREESDATIDTARDPEERALLMFPFHTGARAGEQLALEWGDIDWKNRLVVFRRSRTGNYTGPTKSGRERKVPLTTALEAALKAMRHLRSNLVFCREDGKPLSIFQLHERIWRACRKAGLRKIRWHDTRHSFASQLVMAGTPLPKVKEWLGHSTIAMTMRYAHFAPGGGREFLAALDGPAEQSYGNRAATGEGRSTKAG